MEEKIHHIKLFVSKYRVSVSFILSFSLFLFLLLGFPSPYTRTSGRVSGFLLFSGDMIGKPLTCFIMALLAFGLFYVVLNYDDYGNFDKKKKIYNEITRKVYAEAALELQNRDNLKMDVWGKALLEAKGNEELAKAKYIQIRVKEGLEKKQV